MHKSNLEEVFPVQIDSPPNASDPEKPSSCRSEELKKIKDQLASRIPLDLKVVSIVGMGGIGKTTLAKSIYEDIEILHHFHLRSWITVSQEYALRNLLLGLLKSIDSIPNKISDLDIEDLAHELYKCLKGKRFLIVIDDVWNVEIWNGFKWIFPNDNNGSRVLLTSRHMDVAEQAEPHSPSNLLNCLSIEESWRLLCDEVFRGKLCPPKLVKIGKGIAKKCQGLPLAIVVVAGHLSNIDKSERCWADVAKRLESLITTNDETILDILCLSYNHLPQHLKACFLYMGIFPKNSKVHVFKLIRMWSAMGFPLSEDVAEKCLQDLISRNLIVVRDKGWDGTAKTCGVHDLLWDLSLREAQKEGHFIISQSNFKDCYFNATTYDDVSTYRYLGHSFDTDFPRTTVWNCFTQLRVLDIQSQEFYVFPETITSLVGLRYLELYTFYIPESVSRSLCNLETLIISSKWKRPILPKNIWLLSHLRHLHVENCAFIPGAYVKADGKYISRFDGSLVPFFPDLQTLSTIHFASRIDESFSRIPNLKRLKIFEVDGEEEKNFFNFLNNLACLIQLEKLNLHFSCPVRRQQQIPWCDFFPPSVKQLTLKGSKLPWEDMNILAMLPNIEVLKLKKDAFEGRIYEQSIEGFPRLKVLLFEDLDVEQWIVETVHYPDLQHLVLKDCSPLEGIPYCFGEIPTLESINLAFCSRFVEESARIIQQEQQSMGNFDFHVHIFRTGVRKKVVVKLAIHGGKEKRKAMKSVSCLYGIDSISLDMREKRLTVVGDVDPVDVICKLRKTWHTEIVSVGPAEEPEKKKKGEGKEEGTKEEKKKTEAEQIAELVKLYKDYDHYMTQCHVVHSAEENPNSCVIC